MNDLRHDPERLAGERGGHRLPAWLAAAQDPGAPRAARGQDRDRRYRAAPRHPPVHRAGDGRSARVDTDQPGLQPRAHPGRQAQDQRAPVGATRGRHRPEPRRVLALHTAWSRASEPVLRERQRLRQDVRPAGAQRCGAGPGRHGRGAAEQDRRLANGHYLAGIGGPARPRFTPRIWPRPRRSTHRPGWGACTAGSPVRGSPRPAGTVRATCGSRAGSTASRASG